MRLALPPIARRPRLLLALYAASAALVTVQQAIVGHSNNLSIFRSASLNLLAGRDLYAAHPEQHFDFYKYSPTFALLFAPLAYLPFALAFLCWSLLNGLLLWYALDRLLPEREATVALALLYLEVLLALQYGQSNALVAALMILAFVAFEARRPFAAAASITLGAAVKLFPLAGVSLAAFYPRRLRFAALFIAVLTVAIALPLVAIPPGDLLAQYRSWHAIEVKDALRRGYSLMHYAHAWFGVDWPNWRLQAAGTALLLLPVALRRDRWASLDCSNEPETKGPPMIVRRLALASLAWAAACSRPAPHAAGPSVVTITATDYAFGVPDTIPAGLTTFRLVNQGKELHHANLVRLGEGKTVADFQAGLAAAMKNHTPPPSWMGFAGGPNAVTLGDTGVTTQMLEPGTYVFVCWIPSLDGVPHVIKGMLHPLLVTPRAAAPAPAEPATDVTIKLTDYDFQLSQPLTAGKHVVRVENSGAQAHEIVIAALSAGKTLQDFIAWEAGGEKGPLPTGEWLGGVTTLDVGGHAQFAATFAPGSYLLLCFWPDAKDGKPHIMHGMAKQIVVS